MSKIKLDRDDLNRLHDAFLGITEISATDGQIIRLVELCPTWDGIVDTLGTGDVMDVICLHFVGMKVPMYGSPDTYEDEFRKKVEDKKSDIKEFLNN